MTQTLLIGPVLLSFVTGILCYVFRHNTWVCRSLSVAGSVLVLGVSAGLFMVVWSHGPVAMQASNWPAPFGITFVADMLSAVMVLMTGIMGLLVTVYSLGDITQPLQRSGYYALYHVLLAGVAGAFLTGDIFNLYVWFEVMLMASFGLIVLGGSKAQMDGGIRYVAINLVSTVMFLMSVAMLYGMTGTLNMADLHVTLRDIDNPALLTVVATLFILGFGIKSALFPLFFWLPASYHTPAVSVTAIFGALLTKVGVYALIRVFTLIFTHDIGFTHNLLLIIAGFTMVTGVLGAAAQMEVRRLLSFHIISQIGYMIMGLALFTPLGLAAALFYMVHNIVAKTNLFLISGVMQRLGGSFHLYDIGSFYKRTPFVAILFMISAFGLAGMPPLSGFWGKFALVKASLETEAYVIAGVALAVGLMTLFSMTKIWGEAFWKPHPRGDDALLTRLEPHAAMTLMAPIVALAIFTVLMGLLIQPVFDVALVAGNQVMSNQAYVDAVLGSRETAHVVP